MKTLHEKIKEDAIRGTKAKITKIQDEQTEFKKELNRINVLVVRNRGRLSKLLSELEFLNRDNGI